MEHQMTEKILGDKTAASQNENQNDYAERTGEYAEPATEQRENPVQHTPECGDQHATNSFEHSECPNRGSFKAQPVLSLTRQQVASALKEMGQPKFRAQQVLQWIYQKGVRSYDEMTNVSQALRSELAARYPLFAPEVILEQVSTDGSRKFLIQFNDGVTCECVGMPTDNRLTVCVSTQAGCNMRCSFCATGKSGLTRSLTCGEIAQQVITVARAFDTRVSHVVLMGQGEPFTNYDNALEAMRIMNDPKLLNIGARHITVSTCGIIPQISKFAQEPEQFTLAVSLHSAVQSTRNALMPGVKKFTLERLREALELYVEKTGRRVSFEYALIRGVNDTSSELNALASYTESLLCHVNFILLNEVRNSPYKPSVEGKAETFVRRLERQGTEATIRRSRGQDIDAACGQLRQKHL